MTHVIDGNAVAESVRDDVRAAIDELEADDVTPGLATVLMGGDDGSATYVAMKQRACEEVGIDGTTVEIDPEEPPEALYEVIDDLNDDPAIHGILVQMPVPDHVPKREVLSRVDPLKDVDGFHPENVGRMVSGHPRFKPCTPHGIQKLLASADVDPEGMDAVVLGRSEIVGKPMANLLMQKAAGGNATVTVCHSRTQDLAEKTRAADLVVAAVGRPEMLTGDMLSEGTVVIDVGTNRVDADNEKGYELTGDVDFESAREKASVISPSPGGVGPMTITMLLYNTVKAASLQSGVDVGL
ncbi:tetrahydrofolate dehydrogenase/cyclohydrolase catalytic domain-containing protein [Haloarchaeobius salinus]|uniref:tetrahydrofolate dehydrogenase/cyclohydrolase catalytic domain-containing protein n=1 Tax=Haloarchaeobius salinus TaxID=1198298 RepID=UPI00210B8433|nr:tetrahydrofolate dehydrogenase/cyclohydrolase catalytic domain-containing protein [Haloarchaeobius salinus]